MHTNAYMHFYSIYYAIAIQLKKKYFEQSLVLSHSVSVRSSSAFSGRLTACKFWPNFMPGKVEHKKNMRIEVSDEKCVPRIWICATGIARFVFLIFVESYANFRTEWPNEKFWWVFFYGNSARTGQFYFPIEKLVYRILTAWFQPLSSP